MHVLLYGGPVGIKSSNTASTCLNSLRQPSLPPGSRFEITSRFDSGVNTAWPCDQCSNPSKRSGSTVTSNVQRDTLPASSVAVQVTVVVPTANILPDGGVQLIVGLASISSVAVTAK